MPLKKIHKQQCNISKSSLMVADIKKNKEQGKTYYVTMHKKGRHNNTLIKRIGRLLY
jgi:hypothetical protein